MTANAALPDTSIFGGYIVISPGNGAEAVHVPYAGLKGNYQSIPVLTPTQYGFPWLAQAVGNSLFNRPNGATYTLQNGDIPYFLLHLDHHAAWLRMEVFEANASKKWQVGYYEEHLPRNSTSTSYFAFPWDGLTVNGARGQSNKTNVLPNGQYIVKVTVLKALGKESNPGDTETWASPVITLARP